MGSTKESSSIRRKRKENEQRVRVPLWWWWISWPRWRMMTIQSSAFIRYKEGPPSYQSTPAGAQDGGSDSLFCKNKKIKIKTARQGWVHHSGRFFFLSSRDHPTPRGWLFNNLLPAPAITSLPNDGFSIHNNLSAANHRREEIENFFLISGRKQKKLTSDERFEKNEETG